MSRRHTQETDETVEVPMVDEPSILALVFQRVDQLWEEHRQRNANVRVLVVQSTAIEPMTRIWVRDAFGLREIDFEQYRALNKVEKTNPFNPIKVTFVIYPGESQVFIAIQEDRMSNFGSTYRIVSRNERLELEFDPDGDGYIS